MIVEAYAVFTGFQLLKTGIYCLVFQNRDGKSRRMTSGYERVFSEVPHSSEKEECGIFSFYHLQTGERYGIITESMDFPLHIESGERPLKSDTAAIPRTIYRTRQKFFCPCA